VKIRRVYVQARDRVPSDEAFFKAWDGFRKRGVPCEVFDPEQLHRGVLPLARDTLVAGGLRVVEAALAALGVVVPEADNLPACLARYRGRKVWASTWGELRARYGEAGPPEPLFVKPLRRNKGFPALALYDADDLATAAHLPDDLEVLAAEYVVFASEWRCYVCGGQILELCHYQGDPFVYPDPQVIKGAVADYGRLAPAGYGIDFGVLTDGQTVLVEVNDGYALGSYGLNAVEYAELLEARWVQLAGG
jgi:ATP-grasp domain, R2K clade family 2